MMIWNLFRGIILGIWDFIFLFFGMSYEKQSDRLNLDKHDKDIRGPDNPKTKRTVYRANKVGAKK
ncbi:MAG: hypothetical protein Q9M39_04160 [Sulfurovum sp.]|nr:hypothetical protein [Sulfurovum sp.]